MDRYTLFIKYAAVGLLGAFIQTFSLYVWVTLLSLQSHYLWGVAVGFCLALAATFTLQKYWTFRDGAHERAPRQLIWYTAIALLSLGLNTGLLYLAKEVIDALGLDFFQGWYLLAQVLIVGVVAALSFVLNRIFTFAAV